MTVITNCFREIKRKGSGKERKRNKKGRVSTPPENILILPIPTAGATSGEKKRRDLIIYICDSSRIKS